MMPRAIYEKFVKGYTEKQWGCRARSCPPPSLATRFDVREDDEAAAQDAQVPGVPVDGYAVFMKNLTGPEFQSS